MRIKLIDTNNHKEVKSFIEFPFSLYANVPYWVPPLIVDMKTIMNRKKYPFYKHSDADFFIAIQDGKVVGRIAAIENRRYNQFNNEKSAFFYFYEVIKDKQVSTALFDKVYEWASQRGLNNVFGPKGLLQMDGYGVLVEGFELPPPMNIAYNPPYYDDFILSAGFEKVADYYSGNLTREYHLPKRIFELADKVKERRGFRVKNFKSKDEIKKWIPKLRIVYNQAFAGSTGFTPISEAEMTIIANRILAVAIPNLIKLIFKGNEIVGFIIAYPNINKGLRKAGGKLFPFGLFHIRKALKTTNIVDFNGIGLLPDHQGVGATAVLYTELAKTIRKYRFNTANLVQVREDNIKSMADMKALGIVWNKRHRIYRKELYI